jgi:Fe-S oxidoreductase
MKQRIKGRENYPTKEVDPKNYIEDNQVKVLVEDIKNIKFTEQDFLKLYNCVDCGECETEKERIFLKQKYIEQSNTFEGLKGLREWFEEFRTPFPSKKMRIKRPEGIQKESNTLFFMGCLSTIRIPTYTEHALQYLLRYNIDFTILDEEICCGWPWYASGLLKEYEVAKKENIEIFKNFKKIICLCPACYYLFKTDYAQQMEKKIQIDYIADYLRPSENKKNGNVAFQHLCQLMNRGSKGVDKFVESIFKKSGYTIVNIPHWCCGAGNGKIGRIDIIDTIAEKRIRDFDKNGIDYATTYCVSCWWFLSRFGKKYKIKPKIKDIFELLL